MKILDNIHHQQNFSTYQFTRGVGMIVRVSGSNPQNDNLNFDLLLQFQDGTD